MVQKETTRFPLVPAPRRPYHSLQSLMPPRRFSAMQLRAACVRAKGAALRDAFLALTWAYPDDAVLFFSRDSIRLWSVLDPEDLAPLLHSLSPEVRTAMREALRKHPPRY